MINEELKCSKCERIFSTNNRFWLDDNPLCHECDKEDRKYRQKFMELDKDPIFKHHILEYIDTNRIIISDLVKHFQKELGAEIFQHNVDISISVKFSIDYLLKKEIIKLYANDKDIINYPLTKEQHRDLIAEENGIVKCNLIIVV